GLETAGGFAGRAGLRGEGVFDVRIESSVVVERLREIAGALERGRDAIADHVAAAFARREFLRVEEEQLVAPARFSDGTADREPEILLAFDGFRIPVEPVDLAVGVPVGVAGDVVGRSAELVRAALGDRRQLKTAR